jgi:hypothetical protein
MNRQGIKLSLLGLTGETKGFVKLLAPNSQTGLRFCIEGRSPPQKEELVRRCQPSSWNPLPPGSGFSELRQPRTKR